MEWAGFLGTSISPPDLSTQHHGVDSVLVSYLWANLTLKDKIPLSQEVAVSLLPYPECHPSAGTGHVRDPKHLTRKEKELSTSEWWRKRKGKLGPYTSKHSLGCRPF